MDSKIVKLFLTCQGKFTSHCFLEINLLESQNSYSQKGMQVNLTVAENGISDNWHQVT